MHHLHLRHFAPGPVPALRSNTTPVQYDSEQRSCRAASQVTLAALQPALAQGAACVGGQAQICVRVRGSASEVAAVQVTCRRLLSAEDAEAAVKSWERK
eukprot:3873435-Rhodomonas_salina.2